MNSSVLQHILNMKQATLWHGHVWLSGTGLLLFIEDVTADRNSKINYEAICSLLRFRQMLHKLTKQPFTAGIANGPKLTAKRILLKRKNCNILQWPPQSPDHSLIQQAFYLLNRETHKHAAAEADCSEALTEHPSEQTWWPRLLLDTLYILLMNFSQILNNWVKIQRGKLQKCVTVRKRMGLNEHCREWTLILWPVVLNVTSSNYYNSSTRTKSLNLNKQ